MKKTITKTQHSDTLKKVLIALSALGVIFYILFHMQNIFTGPKLTVINPVVDGLAKTNLITISGSAERAESVFVNDNKVPLNEKYEFSLPLLLLSGYNAITVRATDRFGKESIRKISIVGPSLY